MEREIPCSQGYIADVTQGGGREANAENMTFYQKFKRGYVQRSCPGTIQFYSILPVQFACNKLMLQVQNGYRTRLLMLPYLCYNAQVTCVYF
jgi:hypothetical protein